jgi:hypothetical protein
MLLGNNRYSLYESREIRVQCMAAGRCFFFFNFRLGVLTTGL